MCARGEYAIQVFMYENLTGNIIGHLQYNLNHSFLLAKASGFFIKIKALVNGYRPQGVFMRYSPAKYRAPAARVKNTWEFDQ